MSRYDKWRKKRRNLAIVQIRREQPDLSLDEIGAMFGVSRQRIHYLLKRDGVNHA